MSIDESDFRVAMPEDVAEMVNFHSSDSSDAAWVCFSTYQRELNKLYMIASPAIKQVYGANEADNPGRAQMYSALMEEVTARLWHWHQELPDNLSLDLSRDSPAALSTASRAHCLQSLALQLTFDSLLIILYRPSLRGQMSALQNHGIGRDHGLGISALRSPRSQSGAPSRAPSEETTLPPTETSQEQWWRAASRTATVARLPRLADVACDGHLVAFLAINLFNAAVVMVVLALSDPLSDRAQEAKRAVAWIYRLLGVLGTRASPSKQSVAVLRSLIALLSRRESDAILAFSPLESMRAAEGQQEDPDLLARMRETSALPSRSTNARMPTNGSRTCDDTNLYSTARINDSLASVQRGKIVCPPQFPMANSSKRSMFVPPRLHSLPATGILIPWLSPQILVLSLGTLQSVTWTSCRIRTSALQRSPAIGVQVMPTGVTVCTGFGMRAGTIYATVEMCLQLGSSNSRELVSIRLLWWSEGLCRKKCHCLAVEPKRLTIKPRLPGLSNSLNEANTFEGAFSIINST